MTLEEILEKCTISPTGCILYPITKNMQYIYPQIIIDGKRMQLSHWILSSMGKEVPHGMQVNHTCDTPACINPFHLYIGTCSDNVQDARQRGKRRYHTYRKTIQISREIRIEENEEW